MAWADPIDLFFLEIQGSGSLKFKSGAKMRIGYDGQNGYPYYPIGRSLKPILGEDGITLQTIESYLRSLSAEEAEQIMAENRSYIFFRKLEGRGETFFGTQLVDRRVIATDPKYFPKGALAFVEYQRPEFLDSNAMTPSAWLSTRHFVFDQDVGGAIRGPGRMDLFWGQGSLAKQSAGVIKNVSTLTYLVPRDSDSVR